MKLADAIDGWGSENRDRLSPDELQELAGVWRAIRGSDMRDLDFDTMSRDDAKAVMALFPSEQRTAVSETLNHVRQWAIEQHIDLTEPPPLDAQPLNAPPSADAPVVVIDENPTPVRPVNRATLPGSETVVMRRGEVAPEHGAVDGWEPPQTIDESSNGSGRLIAGLLIALLAVIAIWYFATRGDDETPVVTGAEPTGTDEQPAADTGTAAAPSDQPSSDTTTDSPPAADVPAVSGDTGDFCAVAQQLADSDPLADASTALFSADFFDRADQVYAGIGLVAPNEIAGDVSTIRSAIAELGTIMKEADYDPFDPNLSAALDQYDSVAVDAAGARLDAYTLAACGIDLNASPAVDAGVGGGDAGTVIDSETIRTLEDISPEEAQLLNDLFLAQFGIDGELAACLTNELGDLTEAAANPAILNQEICGTTLFAIISGTAGG